MGKFNTARAVSPNRHADVTEAPQDVGKAAFEPGVYSPDGTFIFTKNPPPEDLRQVYEMSVAEIGPNVASFEVIKSVYETNPIALWGIYRSNDEQRLGSRLVGFIA